MEVDSLIFDCHVDWLRRHIQKMEDNIQYTNHDPSHDLRADLLSFIANDESRIGTHPSSAIGGLENDSANPLLRQNEANAESSTSSQETMTKEAALLLRKSMDLAKRSCTWLWDLGFSSCFNNSPCS